MPTDFENALRIAEGKLSYARDEQDRYEALAKRWRGEVTISQRVVDAMREAAGVPLDAPLWRPNPTNQAQAPRPSMRDNAPPPPLPGPTIADTVRKEVEAKASGNFPPAQGANGFDRLAIQRKCREWHISYPVKKSYLASSAQVRRQAMKATLVAHPKYQSWLDTGHKPVMSSAGIGMPELRHCAKFLGVDIRAVEHDAVRLYNDIVVYGVEGVDYQRSPSVLPEQAQ